MDSTGEDPSLMELLPTEILQKILSNLPAHDRVRVERVCKRWKNVSTERVWRDKQVLTIAPRFQENFDLFCYPFTDSNNFDKFNTMNNNKLYIDVDQLGAIESLVSRAGQHIKEFIYDAKYFDGNNIPMLSIITTYCHNIESIQLGHCGYLNDGVLSRLFQINKQLHSIACCFVPNLMGILPLRDWKSLYIDGPSNLQREHLENKVIALIENSPSLEKFYICKWTLNIAEAISKCEQLKHLSFPIWNEEVEDYLMMDTPLLNRLTCLKAQGLGDKEDQMINLLRHCINLESLHLSYWDYKISDGVEKAMLDLPKLKSLELTIPGLTDGMLSRLEKLKDLKLKDHYDYIEEHEIFKMIINSECLEKLEILNKNVTSKLFKRLVQTVGQRRNILKIRVNPGIYEEALEICKGSRIDIITELDDLVSDIRNWTS